MMGYGRELGYGYGNMMGGSPFVGFLMFVFGALVIAGIVLLVVWAVRAASGHPPSPNSGLAGQSTPPGAVGHDEAVAIAKRRLASGEITPEQYSEIMRTLGG
jgi:uncharacterized membrane protein